MEAEQAARRIDARAAELIGCSEEPGRLTRRFATPALVEAGALVAGWMEEAGMAVRVDAVGNVCGRREGRSGPGLTLLIGSHLDTVRNAGRWDGTLGVLVGIAVAEAFAAEGGPPIALEVVGFADEEGARYGVPYLGSTALAGTFDPAWLARRDADGIAMADAIRAAGGDPAGVAGARRDPADLLGYLEVHLEQGPVLEAEGLPLGVVTGIVGQSRARLTVTGEAGHAGTVPQARRRDALCAAAEVVLAVESLALRTPGLVATVGELTVEPGVGNAIPGRTVFGLDLRHESDAVRESAVAELRDRAGEVVARRGVGLAWEVLTDQGAVACDPRLTAALEQAVAAGGSAARRLASGAGHDGAALAPAIPIAMLFVRHPGGFSHRPDEAADVADIAAAVEATTRAVELLAAGAPAAEAERA